MTIKDGKYPNKADYEPNIDKHLKDGILSDELPLSDPSESDTTKEFRLNESKTEGENEPSAFSENKNIPNQDK